MVITMNVKEIILRIISNRASYRQNRRNTRDFNVWIFGEWFGQQCSDNVLTFSRYAAQKADDSIKLYWITDKTTDTTFIDKRIKVVDISSEEAINLQKMAGVAVMNQGYDDFSAVGNNYLGNAITLNLWHGVMWKKIGFDSYPDNILTKLYITSIQNAKQYTFYCAPSVKYKELFTRAFKCSSSTPIMCGLPRNDLFFDDNQVKASKNMILGRLERESHVVNESTRIIAYMPTFRDKSANSFSFDSFANEELTDILEKHNCVIVQKAHNKNIARGMGYDKSPKKRVINIDNVSAQSLLAASDVLITDYSSCFFDFLLLDRPIIQFVYDFEYYSSKDRGLYYSIDKVDCGAVCMNESELVKNIEESITYPSRHQAERTKVRDEFMTFDKGNSCEVIFDHIISKIGEYEKARR